MNKMTKVFIVLVLGMIISLYFRPAHSQEVTVEPGLKFGWVETSDIKDVQMLLRSVGDKDNRSFAGTGVCSSPLWNLYYGKRWISDFVSVCGMAAISIQDEADARVTGGIEAINLLGLRVYGGYIADSELSKGSWTIGGGLSFTGLTDQLLK